MAVALSILFLMPGFQGIYGISTVSVLSVKAGNNVSIPCLYEPKYKNHVKYLCRGYTWESCTYEIKTNQRNSEKYSINDDKTQRVFTVTIKDVTHQAGFYWCNVEIDHRPDDGERFELQVTKDTPGLMVTNQEIGGFIGEKTSISCFSQQSRGTRWCKLGRLCVTGSSRWIDGSEVTINSSVPRVFTVTMSNLGSQHAGWYYCASGNLQMPVRLTVTQRPSTTSFHSSVGPTQQTSTSVDTSSVSTENPSTTGQTPQRRSPVNHLSLIVSLSLLIVIALVAMLIWLFLRKRKQTEAQPSDISTGEDTTVYTTVKKNTRSSEQTRMKSDEAVIYSDVVFMRRMNAPKVDTNDPDVTYSTVSRYN